MKYSHYSKIVKHLLNYFFPRACFGCNALLSEEEQTLCYQCAHELPFTDNSLVERRYFKALFYTHPLVKEGHAFYLYQEQTPIARLFKQLKFRGHEWIGIWLTQLAFRQFAAYEIDLVIPIPIHLLRLQKRGYNQVHGMAKILAKYHKVDIDTRALKVRRFSPSQTRGGQRYRHQNRQGYFYCPHPERVKGKRVLVVDDIVTTGATLDVAFKCLEGAGVREIYWISLGWTTER